MTTLRLQRKEKEAMCVKRTNPTNLMFSKVKHVFQKIKAKLKKILFRTFPDAHCSGKAIN
jgi:hypothetical protein